MAHLGRGTRGGASLGRRLSFESLERRELLAVMRLVNWNTLNGPNDPAGDANFQTVFAAIAGETLAGNTKRIDILALQETDPPGAGSESILRIESIFDTLYPMSDYASAVSTVDGGGDSTGFVYDTSSVSLLESTTILPASLTHSILRGKFRPAATLGESDFYVYSIHLKSGDTGSDVTIRGTEASLLRADADALGEGAHVLFVGDFNMKRSTEIAYGNFVAAGAGQVQDVVPESTGDWIDNLAFKSLHTQDPQAAMDDRFDLQLASGELFDGVGLEYVTNSFRVFGNDGSHTLNGAITTGSGASAAVLTALVAASDHLPVVADYQIIVSTPSVRITETLGGTKVVEGGLYDTYHVVLDTVPAADVSVTVTPDAEVDVGNGAGVPKVFTFTPANALTPQTVEVHAADDVLGEGVLGANHTGLIAHTSVSSDATYNGLSISNVIASIVDNDFPVLVINEVDADQIGTDNQEFVEIYDGGVGHVSLNGKFLALFNGATDTAYTIISFTASDFTDANGFFVIGDSAVSPAPNKLFSTSVNSIQNGADAVALYSGFIFLVGTHVSSYFPIDALVYDTGQADDPILVSWLLIPGQPQINENQNSLGTTQSMSRVPDGGTQRITTTYVAQTPTPGTFNEAQPFGVEFLQSASRIDVQEGGATDSYQIALVSIPTANVLITVDPDGQTDLGAGAGVPIVLTFTPANALIPQMITVAAVDDLAIEGVHTSTITHTAYSLDSGYDAIAIGNVVANIVDNDEPPTTSIVISEIMFNPASDEMNPGVGEWIEIINTGVAAVDLGGWLLDDEDAANWGAIPAGTILSTNQAAVFFDESFTTAAEFRAEWAVPAGALVIGIPWASLANSPSATNEILVLLDSGGMQIDLVNYDDAAPWPVGSVDGPSLYLKVLSLDNNDGASWARSAAGIGGAVSPAGPTFDTADVGSPGRFFLPADYNASGGVDAADYVLWRKTNGSTSDLRADGSGPTVGMPDGVVDQLDYDFWRANFGAVGIPGSGSGAGAGGGLLASAAASVSLVSMALEVPLSATTSAVEVATDGLAVDAALNDFGMPPSANGAGKSARPLPRSRTMVPPTEPTDLLFVVSRASSAAGSSTESHDLGVEENAADDLSEVDAFFASLDDWVPSLGRCR